MNGEPRCGKANGRQRILLKTTIPFTEDDWHIGRFSFLQTHLRSLRAVDGGALYDVDACDRIESVPGTDADLQAAAAGIYDQVWLIGTDAAGALTPRDIAALDAFRRSILVPNHD